jgi:hypothetical protein
MADKPKIWTGSQWVDLVGPEGPAGSPGPTVVSADAGNASRLGTDGRIYTPTVTPGISQADADARYVEVAGDTMTGPLTVATKLSVDTTGGVGIAEIASLPVFGGGSVSGSVLTLEGTAGQAAIRLGTSATATNNIFIDSVGDGRLAFRAAGQTGDPTQIIGIIGKSSVGWNTDAFNLATASGMAFAGISQSATAFNTTTFTVNTTGGDAVASITASSTGFRTDLFRVSTASGAAVAGISQSATAFSTDSFTVNTAAGTLVASITASSTGFATDAVAFRTAAGEAYATFSRTGGAQIISAAFTVNDEDGETRLNVSATGSRIRGPEVAVLDESDYRLGTFRDRAFAVGTLLPLTESASAQIVVVGDDLGGVAASAASTLAQSNTRATVSIRPSPFSGFTLAIGSESTNNGPYLQGVNYAGGSASSPLSINPFGGGIGIGCIPTVAGVEAEVGGDLLIRGAVNCSGNITSNGTAHAFAANSIPQSAVAGLSQAALDARYVETAGDTITGTLAVTGGLNAGPARSGFLANSEPYAVGLRYSAAVGPVYIGCSSAGDFQVSNAGGVSILSVDGQTGNITSTGAAHSFADGSIPSPAVIGNTPRTIAATGSAGFAGQMVWDDDFIYLRTTSGWKKVALTAI